MGRHGDRREQSGTLTDRAEARRLMRELHEVRLSSVARIAALVRLREIVDRNQNAATGDGSLDEPAWLALRDAVVRMGAAEVAAERAISALR